MDLIKWHLKFGSLQFWSEIILARSFDFEITRMISEQIALHTVQLLLFIQSTTTTTTTTTTALYYPVRSFITHYSQQHIRNTFSTPQILSHRWVFSFYFSTRFRARDFLVFFVFLIDYFNFFLSSRFLSRYS